MINEELIDEADMDYQTSRRIKTDIWDRQIESYSCFVFCWTWTTRPGPETTAVTAHRTNIKGAYRHTLSGTADSLSPLKQLGFLDVFKLLL